MSPFTVTRRAARVSSASLSLLPFSMWRICDALPDLGWPAHPRRTSLKPFLRPPVPVNLNRPAAGHFWQYLPRTLKRPRKGRTGLGTRCARARGACQAKGSQRSLPPPGLRRHASLLTDVRNETNTFWVPDDKTLTTYHDEQPHDHDKITPLCPIPCSTRPKKQTRESAYTPQKPLQKCPSLPLTSASPSFRNSEARPGTTTL